jgi:hypothetical protein
MPTDSSVERSLRELHAPRVEPPSPTLASEEAAILAWARRHEAQREAQREALAEPRWFGLLGARKAVAAFAGALLVAGACVLPTSYDIPLGLAVDIRAASGERLPVQELSRHVQSVSGAAEVDVLMREVVLDGGPPQMQLSIRLWDQNLALGELEPELREQFPALANAEIIETALEGEIETIWARRLAHRAFAISLRDADVEQARQALLLDLQSRGHEPDQVVVMVRDRDDGHREIEVQVQRHVIEGGAPPPLDAAPSFFWEMDPSGPPEVQLEAPRVGEPVRIHVVGVQQER